MRTLGKTKVAAIVALSVLAISAFLVMPAARAQTNSTGSLIGVRGHGIAVGVSDKELHHAKFGLLLSVESEGGSTKL